MLDPKTWLAVAQALPLDGQRRVKHDCGAGTPLVVYHKDDGWSAYCHRCGEPGFVPRPAESLSERLARIAARQQVEANASRSVVPPQPMITDVQLWPAQARVWLYKAGLSNDDILTLGIYYHEQTDRVVVPVVDDGLLVYWQARAYDWTPASSRPKYLNPVGASNSGVSFTVDACPTITLVEDYLSAYRVYMAGFSSLCLLGTSLNDRLLSRILGTGCAVLVWLDNDLGRRNGSNPGQEAAREIVNTLAGCGVTVRNIVSERDPKLNSRKEIMCLLN